MYSYQINGFIFYLFKTDSAHGWLTAEAELRRNRSQRERDDERKKYISSENHGTRFVNTQWRRMKRENASYFLLQMSLPRPSFIRIFVILWKVEISIILKRKKYLHNNQIQKMDIYVIYYTEPIHTRIYALE